MIPASFAGLARARLGAVAALAVLLLAGVPPAAAQRFDRGLLWSVAGAGAPASYVFGTIHVSDPRVTRLPAPVARALMLSVPPQNPREVLDIALAAMARTQGKPVYELEGLEEQVAVFDGMSETDQVTLLRQAVEEHERMPRVTGRLIEAWLARDLAGMRRISAQAGAGGVDATRVQERFMQRLLIERNARMAERMTGGLKEGGAFFAIGALHLEGDRGVLAELERRGWRVARVY
jgi:uncharacterized protein YbaP (TraB family)